MKPLLLSLFIFAGVFLLSSALPEDVKDRHSLLEADTNHENEKPLQRRRPPIKVPGPKLKKDDETPEILTGSNSEMKSLSDEDKRKKDLSLRKDKNLDSLDDDSKRGEKGKKGKGKDKDLVRRNEHNLDNEETQEERNSNIP